ncbi:hypothetical protein FHT21_000552 [Pedobacter sp. SG908]|nr:hypothetical protein [Pedobacter sp. SG908]NMN35511.1 hypothetical protein [Pedobacter sp. SG918]
MFQLNRRKKWTDITIVFKMHESFIEKQLAKYGMPAQGDCDEIIYTEK